MALLPFMLLSPLGERLGEGALRATILVTPSLNLSTEVERNMTHESHAPST